MDVTWIVAANAGRALGMLRKLLDQKVTAAVTLEMNKDYTQLNADELCEQVQSHRQKA